MKKNKWNETTQHRPDTRLRLENSYQNPYKQKANQKPETQIIAITETLYKTKTNKRDG